MRRKNPNRREMNGLFLIRKPPSITSHDVISRMRRILGLKKVGHFGTLDPLATGLLLVAVGRATRLFPFYLHADKTYEGRIRLGFSTDTYDAEGRPSSERSTSFPDLKELLREMSRWEGTFLQTAPVFSAKKIHGRPSHRLARQSKPAHPKKTQVTVYSFRLVRYSPPHIDFTLHCSSGTYVRSLAHDLGQALGCGAHLARLERTAVGSFFVRDALSLEEVARISEEDRLENALLPLESLLPEYPSITVDERGVELALHGSEIPPQHILEMRPGDLSRAQTGKREANTCRVFDGKGRLRAFARKESGNPNLKPFLVLGSPAGTD